MIPTDRTCLPCRFWAPLIPATLLESFRKGSRRDAELSRQPSSLLQEGWARANTPAETCSLTERASGERAVFKRTRKWCLVGPWGGSCVHHGEGGVRLRGQKYFPSPHHTNPAGKSHPRQPLPYSKLHVMPCPRCFSTRYHISLSWMYSAQRSQGRARRRVGE